MSAGPKSRREYDDVVLDVLVYEFPFNDKGESERKIKRRLRDKKLGRYEQTRIDLLRRFKDSIQKEIHLWKKSKYCTYPRGRGDPRRQRYADMDDFDRKRMVKDHAAAFPSVPKGIVESFVNFAVFIYYVK